MSFWPSFAGLAYITVVIAKHVLAHACGLCAGALAGISRAALLIVPLTGPERLRTALEDLGGTFIKFGQMLALQPDILSLEYCNALFNLLDRIDAIRVRGCREDFRRESWARHRLRYSTRSNPYRWRRRQSARSTWPGSTVARSQSRCSARRSRSTSRAISRLMVAMIALIRRLRLRALYWMLEPMSEFSHGRTRSSTTATRRATWSGCAATRSDNSARTRA